MEGDPRIEEILDGARRNDSGTLARCRARMRAETDDCLLAAMAVAVGQMGDKSDRDLLIGTLAHPNPHVVIEALNALARLKLRVPATLIARLAETGTPEVRQGALSLLATQAPARIIEETGRSLPDADAPLRASLAYLLGSLPGRRRALSMLLGMLREETQEKVLERVCGAIDAWAQGQEPSLAVGPLYALSLEMTEGRRLLARACLQRIVDRARWDEARVRAVGEAYVEATGPERDDTSISLRSRPDGTAPSFLTGPEDDPPPPAATPAANPAATPPVTPPVTPRVTPAAARRDECPVPLPASVGSAPDEVPNVMPPAVPPAVPPDATPDATPGASPGAPSGASPGAPPDAAPAIVVPADELGQLVLVDRRQPRSPGSPLTMTAASRILAPGSRRSPEPWPSWGPLVALVAACALGAAGLYLWPGLSWQMAATLPARASGPLGPRAGRPIAHASARGSSGESRWGGKSRPSAMIEDGGLPHPLSSPSMAPVRSVFSEPGLVGREALAVPCVGQSLHIRGRVTSTTAQDAIVAGDAGSFRIEGDAVRRYHVGDPFDGRGIVERLDGTLVTVSMDAP